MAARVQLLQHEKYLTLFRCVFILITVSGDWQLQAECRALHLVLSFATDAPPLIVFEAGEQSVSRCSVQQEGSLYCLHSGSYQQCWWHRSLDTLPPLLCGAVPCLSSMSNVHSISGISSTYVVLLT